MNSFSETTEYGIETVSRNFKMPSMHYHDSYELYFLEVGTREYFVEDKFFTVSPGEFVLIPPGKLHRTGGEFCVRTLVHFTKEFLMKFYQHIAIEQLLLCFESVKITPEQNTLTWLRSLLTQLHACTNEMDFALLLGALLKTLGNCGKQEVQFGQMGQIVGYINQNFAEIENIDQIAKQFYISKYHLCRVFKKTMHVTLIEYINQVRLKNARRLLEISEYGIGEIALRCGYSSTAYFGCVFKENLGETPSEYRKRMRH